MSIVINEIMVDPSAVPDFNGEWFELYNDDVSDVDINGWIISDGVNFETINNGGPLIVPAGGYLVIGADGNLATNGGVAVDYVWSTLTLVNSSGTVRLLTPGMAEEDRVNYDNSSPYSAGVSMELNDPASDNLSGASGWSAAISPYGDGDLGTPGSLNDAVCFLAGTRIAVPDGESAVEDLQIGDWVRTADGREIPVIWIGRRSMVPLFGGLAACPVCIGAGALGPGVPHSDLYVTPEHGIVLDGLIVNAGALVNGGDIRIVPTSALPERFTVYHVETADHDVILANGAASETYLDKPGRRAFDNFQEYRALFGEERSVRECVAPRIASQRLLPAEIRYRLRCGASA